MRLIASTVQACMIMHNMCVSDRVMNGDVRAVYNPANNLALGQLLDVEQPEDLLQVQGRTAAEERSTIGIDNIPEHARELFTRRENWNDLRSLEEYIRLHAALMEMKEY